MSTNFAQSPSLLPYAGPESHSQLLLLFMIRRLATHGLTDAHATNAMFATFGRNYRRPLLFLRVFMVELTRSSRRHIRIAPCYCLRMTKDEALITDAVHQCCDGTELAYQLLSCCLDTTDCLNALSSAQAINQAFADLGRPL